MPPAARTRLRTSNCDTLKQIRKQYYAAVIGGLTVVNEENFRTYGVSTTPTLVLIDRRGIVRLFHPGAMSYDELRRGIEPRRCAVAVRRRIGVRVCPVHTPRPLPGSRPLFPVWRCLCDYRGPSDRPLPDLDAPLADCATLCPAGLEHRGSVGGTGAAGARLASR